MLSQDLFKQNRNKFSKKMSEGGLALFHSNDQMPTNADGLMPFRQNNDLFYLTGIDQEERKIFLKACSLIKSVLIPFIVECYSRIFASHAATLLDDNLLDRIPS